MPELVPPDGPLTATAPQILDWDSQARWYPPSGQPGLSYFAGQTPLGVIDCLLWRNESGELVGILNHYPFRTPEGQEPGTFNVWVKPGWQRRGIATRLANEALLRWRVDLNVQTYTPEGAAATTQWAAKQLRRTES